MANIFDDILKEIPSKPPEKKNIFDDILKEIPSTKTEIDTAYMNSRPTWDEAMAAQNNPTPVQSKPTPAVTPQPAMTRAEFTQFIPKPVKNFEKRMSDPTKVLPQVDGSVATHKMAWDDQGGKFIAFPTIIEENGKLKELDPQIARDYAIKTGEFKEFKTAKEAEEYAAGSWKQGTPFEDKEPAPTADYGRTLQATKLAGINPLARKPRGASGTWAEGTTTPEPTTEERLAERNLDKAIDNQMGDSKGVIGSTIESIGKLESALRNSVKRAGKGLITAASIAGAEAKPMYGDMPETEGEKQKQAILKESLPSILKEIDGIKILQPSEYQKQTEAEDMADFKTFSENPTDIKKLPIGAILRISAGSSANMAASALNPLAGYTVNFSQMQSETAQQMRQLGITDADIISSYSAMSAAPQAAVETVTDLFLLGKNLPGVKQISQKIASKMASPIMKKLQSLGADVTALASEGGEEVLQNKIDEVFVASAVRAQRDKLIKANLPTTDIDSKYAQYLENKKDELSDAATFALGALAAVPIRGGVRALETISNRAEKAEQKRLKNIPPDMQKKPDIVPPPAPPPAGIPLDVTDPNAKEAMTQTATPNTEPVGKADGLNDVLTNEPQQQPAKKAEATGAPGVETPAVLAEKKSWTDLRLETPSDFWKMSEPDRNRLAELLDDKSIEVINALKPANIEQALNPTSKAVSAPEQPQDTKEAVSVPTPNTETTSDVKADVPGVQTVTGSVTEQTPAVDATVSKTETVPKTQDQTIIGGKTTQSNEISTSKAPVERKPIGTDVLNPFNAKNPPEIKEPLTAEELPQLVKLRDRVLNSVPKLRDMTDTQIMDLAEIQVGISTRIKDEPLRRAKSAMNRELATRGLSATGKKITAEKQETAIQMADMEDLFAEEMSAIEEIQTIHDKMFKANPASVLKLNEEILQNVPKENRRSVVMTKFGVRKDEVMDKDYNIRSRPGIDDIANEYYADNTPDWYETSAQQDKGDELFVNKGIEYYNLQRTNQLPTKRGALNTVKARRAKNKAEEKRFTPEAGSEYDITYDEFIGRRKTAKKEDKNQEEQDYIDKTYPKYYDRMIAEYGSEENFRSRINEDDRTTGRPQNDQLRDTRGDKVPTGTEERIDPRHRASVESLGKALSADNKTSAMDANTLPIKPATGNRATNRIISVLRTLFPTVDIFTFVPNENSMAPIRDNGIFYRGKIFINKDSKNAELFTIGHELNHRLSALHPDFKNQVEKYVLANKGSEYQKAYDKHYSAEKRNRQGLSDEAIANIAKEEVISDMAGRLWADPEFWNELHNQSKPLFQRVLRDAIKILTDIINGLKNVPQAKDVVADLVAFRKAYAKMVLEASKKEGGNVETTIAQNAPLFSRIKKIFQTDMFNGGTETQRQTEEFKRTKAEQEAATRKDEKDLPMFNNNEAARAADAQQALFSRLSKKYGAVDIESESFKRWFGNSKVVDENGKPLVVYSGHGNAAMYGTKFMPRKATAGGFYASEDPAIASSYSLGKLGEKEYYENGEQYRLAGKNGELNKKLWQYELSDAQKKKLDEMALEETKYGDEVYRGLRDMRAWAKDNQNYDKVARRLIYQPYNLQNIWDYFEQMGYNITTTNETGRDNPYFTQQQKNSTEDILDALGIKWNSYQWAQPGVMPLYLSIQNPIDAEKPFPTDLLEALDKASRREKKASIETQMYAKWTRDYPLRQWVEDIKGGDEYWSTHIPSKAMPIIRQFGYDGIKELGNKGAKTRAERQTNWIAFNDNQIKSAITNTGAYSADADMRFSRASDEMFDTADKIDELKAKIADRRTLVTSARTTGDGRNVTQVVAAQRKRMDDELDGLQKKLGRLIDQVADEVFGRVDPLYSRLSPEMAEELYGKIESRTNKDGLLKRLRRNDQSWGDALKEFMGDILTPISTRISKLSSSVTTRLRKFDYDIGQADLKDTKAILPWLTKFEKMSKVDQAIYDIALKNEDFQKVTDLNSKYDMAEEWYKVRELLDDIYVRLFNTGFDLGHISEYFPRKIMDADGLLTELGNDEVTKGMIDDEIEYRAELLGRPLTVHEMAQAANHVISRSEKMMRADGSMKARKIAIDEKIDKYYDFSPSAILSYIGNMNKMIEMKKLADEVRPEEKDKNQQTLAPVLEMEVAEGEPNSINLDETIGNYIIKLIAEEKLKPEQQEELVGLLKARFNYKPTDKVVQTIKNIGYLTSMGSGFSSFITQIGDLAWAYYNSPKYATKALGQAIARTVSRGRIAGNTITKEDLGIERMGEEFKTVGGLSKAVNNVFKYTFLSAMDNVGKETLINSAFDKYQSQAKKNDPALMAELERIFGDEAEQVVADLKAGDKNSDNVKFLLFNKLLNFQPISMTEMPKAYLTSPRGRIFYALKTFTIKQLDVFRREGIDAIANAKTPAEKAKAVRNLMLLVGLVIMANGTADEAKDWLFRRKTTLSDKVIDNLLRLVGVSRYTVWEARRNGLSSAMFNLVKPPLNVIELPLRDIGKAYKDLDDDEPVDFKNFESWGMVPFFGKHYDWWFGAASQRQIKKQEKNSPYSKAIKDARKKYKEYSALMKDKKYEEAKKFRAENPEIEAYSAPIKKIKGISADIKKFMRDGQKIHKEITELRTEIEETTDEAVKTKKKQKLEELQMEFVTKYNEAIQAKNNKE